MKFIRSVIWIIPMLGVLIGAFILVTGMATASGAPQEAVVAALACACAILPYCFTRALSEMFLPWVKMEIDTRIHDTDDGISPSAASSILSIGLNAK